MIDNRKALVELTVEEIVQIEEVLLRHRKTPLIAEIQGKLGSARRSVETEREAKTN